MIVVVFGYTRLSSVCRRRREPVGTGQPGHALTMLRSLIPHASWVTP